ncbi:MAG: efflux RND transporter periplasmic adaptor subunit [Myxococcales bacterium]|nr:efflux RND transporter periplasmic adaptor subunit [Myxococcales bacterium]
MPRTRFSSLSSSLALAWTMAAAVVLPTAGCKEKASAAEPAPPTGPKTVKFDPKALARLGVKVDVAGAKTAENDIEVAGSLEYNLERYAEVGVILDGRVSSIHVKVGDAVKRGQLLATVVVPSIAAAQADFVSAEAAARIAKENSAREEALLQRELTTAREAEVARGEAIKTQAELAAATAKLQAFGVARPSGTGTISGAGTLTLASPIEGVVVRREAVLGKFLQPQETAFVIADPHSLRASLNVYEQDLGYFKIGSETTITFDALPGKVVKGTVLVVEPQVGKSSRTARALIEVPNHDGALRPGLFVRASIPLPQEAGEHLLVPASAVQPLADDDVVFVERSEGVFEVRRVEVARRTPQVVTLRAGVSKGERIVVAGGFVLRGEVTKQ